MNNPNTIANRLASSTEGSTSHAARNQHDPKLRLKPTHIAIRRALTLDGLVNAMRVIAQFSAQKARG